MTPFTAEGQYWRMTAKILLIACGALAHELAQLVRLNRWTHVRIRCLPPALHNQPEKIPDAVRSQIEKSRANYDRIFVAYGDCGTGGKIDLRNNPPGQRVVENPGTTHLKADQILTDGSNSRRYSWIRAFFHSAV